jgi:hypothetical protein
VNDDLFRLGGTNANRDRKQQIWHNPADFHFIRLPSTPHGRLAKPPRFKPIDAAAINETT